MHHQRQHLTWLEEKRIGLDQNENSSRFFRLCQSFFPSPESIFHVNWASDLKDLDCSYRIDLSRGTHMGMETLGLNKLVGGWHES